MVTSVNQTPATEIVYPDSDGKPMADNTRQFRWITTVKTNLDWLFAENPDVFVAGDLLWYPVEGDNKTRQAPDVMVAFGRPKGERGSYQQWKEGGIPPRVVFEILSPGNKRAEMARKFLFYDRHGVEEYYIYDPDRNDLEGYIRGENRLEPIEPIDNWISPALGIRFLPVEPELILCYPDGQPFTNYNEERERTETERLRAESERLRAETERERAETERLRAETERQRAESERERAEAERLRAERLAAKLRELNIDPDEG